MNITPYLKLMAERNASDLYFTTGAPASVRIEGDTKPVSRTPLEPGMTKRIAYSIMDEKQIGEFETNKEMNLGLSVAQVGRFRVNIYMQRGEVSMVIRFIKGQIPTLDQLTLPAILKDLVMYKTGLILVVGSTGSGKSTSMAAMIDYRNNQRTGHILTIEDPIEYVFTHKKSIVGQREVGLDTLSYQNALREAMREAPDMIMIGEVRDRMTMEAAIAYADTGHLSLTTLHAVNSNQALDRIINFFPPEGKGQILMDLSLNLRGIISQRLVLGTDGRRVPAVEVLINTPYISELIRKGQMGDIKEIMEKGAVSGMQTFDQSLFDLYKSGKISLQDALANADSRGDLEWRINFGGGVKDVDQASDDLHFPSQINPLDSSNTPKGKGSSSAGAGTDPGRLSQEADEEDIAVHLENRGYSHGSGAGGTTTREMPSSSDKTQVINRGVTLEKKNASESKNDPAVDFSDLQEELDELKNIFGDDSRE